MRADAGGSRPFSVHGRYFNIDVAVVPVVNLALITSVLLFLLWCVVGVWVVTPSISLIRWYLTGRSIKAHKV